MRIECVTEIRNLPDVPDWNRLAGDEPFRSWEWLVSWLESYHADIEILVVLVRDDEEQLIGIAPWFVMVSKSRGRVIKMIGDGKVCSDYLGILCADEHTEDVVAALAIWLTEAMRGEHGDSYAWNVLDFEGVRTNDHSVFRLVEKLGLAESTSISEFFTWAVALPEGWESYLATRSKRRRYHLRKIERENIATGKAKLRIAETQDQVADFTKSLIHLHTLRRAELGCPGCFANDRFAKFMDLAIQRLHAAGRLWLTRLEFEGEPAAASVGIRTEQALYLYQSGFDPRFNKAGWVQNILSMQHAIEAGMTTFDFLRGDEEYKSQLGAEPVPLCRIQVTAPKLTAHVRQRMRSTASLFAQGLPLIADPIRQFMERD